MKDVEDLIIYKQYVELIFYVDLITEKYPKTEKLSLVKEIKESCFAGMRATIEAYKEYDKVKKIIILNNLDVELKMLKVLARISYKQKYINLKNYRAWSKKITNIGNLLGGWIKSCQKQ